MFGKFNLILNFCLIIIKKIIFLEIYEYFI